MGIAGPSKDSLKANQAYEEAETPINARTLTKATTPPVTIKNFFKPKAVEQRPELDENASEKLDQASEENGCAEKECSSDIIKVEVRSSSCTLDKTTDMKQSVPEKSNKGVKSIYFNTKSLKHEGVPQEGTSSTGPSKGNGIVRHLSAPCAKENLEGKMSLKRVNSDKDLRTNKRQKQSTILSSFGKKTVKPSDDAKKDIYCPVCSVKFASDAKNTEINKHIDGCLTK